MRGVPAPLTILIPCRDEAADLGRTIHELPTQVLGHPVRVIVADDGSADASRDVAQACGAQVLPLPRAGLAATFRAGLQAALPGSAAVVVLDADGQYDPQALERLAGPVLRGQADLALAERCGHLTHLSGARRAAHRVGAWAASVACTLPLRDPVSGYRAYGPRCAALQVHESYTYTLETLVQVRPLGLRFTRVQTSVRPVTRPSRLIRSPLAYVTRQTLILLRATWRYRLRPPAPTPVPA